MSAANQSTDPPPPTKSPLEQALESSLTSLRLTLQEMSKASGAATGAQKEEIELLRQEARDIYTRLAGVCADAALAAAGAS